MSERITGWFSFYFLFFYIDDLSVDDELWALSEIGSEMDDGHRLIAI